MNTISKFILCVLLGFNSLLADTYKEVSYPSLDGLEVFAHVYADENRSKPFILLFHQLGYSKGEYLEIAPKLQDMGFNVMAVDLRNGTGVNGIVNQTTKALGRHHVSRSRIAAIQDVKASIDYAKKHYAKGKLLLWGSSYSGSIVLMIAGDDPRVDAVLAFSPGEYFVSKEPAFVQNHVKNMTKPLFFTSAKNEVRACSAIYQAIPSKKKTYFIPAGKGVHGSSALWKRTPNHQEYWSALKAFLKHF